MATGRSGGKQNEPKAGEGDKREGTSRNAVNEAVIILAGQPALAVRAAEYESIELSFFAQQTCSPQNMLRMSADEKETQTTPSNVNVAPESKTHPDANLWNLCSARVPRRALDSSLSQSQFDVIDVFLFSFWLAYRGEK